VLYRTSTANASRHSSPNPRPFNSLQPLCPQFPTPVLCFQSLAASFPKIPGVGYPERIYGTPGWGVPLRHLSDLCVSALSFAVAFAPRSRRFSCLPLSTFRINTCESVSKQMALTTFRINTYVKRGEGGAAAVECLADDSQQIVIPSLPAAGRRSRGTRFFSLQSHVWWRGGWRGELAATKMGRDSSLAQRRAAMAGGPSLVSVCLIGVF
jgi:hypothetical protein